MTVTGILRECDHCDRIIGPFEDCMAFRDWPYSTYCTNCVEENMHRDAVGTGRGSMQNTILTVNGELDDIAIHDVTLFRLEQMDDGCYWIAAYQGDKRISICLASRKRIRATIVEDDLQCEYIEQEQTA